MAQEVIYHNDPADPLFGTTTTIDHLEPPPPVLSFEHPSDTEIILARLDVIDAKINALGG